MPKRHANQNTRFLVSQVCSKPLLLTSNVNVMNQDGGDGSVEEALFRNNGTVDRANTVTVLMITCLHLQYR